MSRKPFLTTKEAAEYLGYAVNTLKQSRRSGTLANVKAPVYYKRGRRVVYSVTDLNVWMSQFPKRHRTT